MATVSIKDVANRAGLSVGTVSNVLNRPDRVAEHTRKRVQAVIAELGFVRNEAARQLRAGSSQCIGQVVLDARNPFFNDVAAGVEAAADVHGLQVLVANSAGDPLREARHLDLFDQQRVRGVLVTPVAGITSHLTRLVERGAAVVVVDADASAEGFSSVGVENVHGGRLAVEHLREQGHQRIAYVGLPSDRLHQDTERRQGAQAVVDEHDDLSLTVVTVQAHTVDEGRAAADQLLALPARQRPTGVFCANDLLALGVLQGATAAGVAVPDDVALIGYDDIAFAAAAAVPLTSVSQPRLQIGSTALELLVRQLDLGRQLAGHTTLLPELVVRESTRTR